YFPISRPLRATHPPYTTLFRSFQDPYGSFDPRQKIWRLVSEPLHLVDEALTRADRRERAAAALAEVGLSPDDLDKYPHEFSGGQDRKSTRLNSSHVKISYAVFR